MIMADSKNEQFLFQGLKIHRALSLVAVRAQPLKPLSVRTKIVLPPDPFRPAIAIISAQTSRLGDEEFRLAPLQTLAWMLLKSLHVRKGNAGRRLARIQSSLCKEFFPV